ncbi:unnamed protein product, partial [Tilletia controversa]
GRKSASPSNVPSPVSSNVYPSLHPAQSLAGPSTPPPSTSRAPYLERRLDVQAAAAIQGLSGQQQHQAAAIEQDFREQGEGDHGLSSFRAHWELSAVDRLEVLMRTRQFKRTVGEPSSGTPDVEEVYSVRTDTDLASHFTRSRVYCE